MNKNDTQSHSSSALRSILQVSGLKHQFVASQLKITPEYLSMILNGKRKAERMKGEVFNFLLQHNLLLKKLAA